MNSAVNINKAKKNAYDEYYTTKEHVEYVFDKHIPKECLKDKIVYSFCDSEESEFVKYIKSHKDELQYKEYIYTSDDYNTHYDLFEKCDVIITNPPFSKIIKEIIPILNRCKKQFFIFGSRPAVHNYYRLFEDKNVKYIINPNIKPYKRICLNYNCPDITKQKTIPTVYITNIKEVHNCYLLPKFNGKNKYVMCQINDTETVRNYDLINNVPIDYYEPVLVPLTVLFEHNRKYFDILDNRVKYYKYSDNKPRYVRYLVQRKKP
jgi:hypothetical protein